jgi:serine phosphatase RsbU (regulator of sigma subunit)
MSPGDVLFLYTDGVYDGNDDEERSQFERMMRNHKDQPAREVCNALLDYAVTRD